jgi:class 3 adenylate cyclase
VTHVGEIETVGDDITGVSVNVAARVASMAGPSQILVSSTVKDLTPGSGLTYEDAGEHELKGVPDLKGSETTPDRMTSGFAA